MGCACGRRCGIIKNNEQEGGTNAVVDIHCHILPEVDDGAESLADALEMARMAARCGVTDLAATSHVRGDETSMDRLLPLYRQFRRLEDAIARERIPLRLYPGAEVLCTSKTVELAREGQLLTIGDTSYVLCEFYFDAHFAQMDEILGGIAQTGYRPVVAHPERYAAIQHEPRRIQQWFRKGYVIQLNKGSLLGAFGYQVQDTACWLLEAGLVHLIASDAHSPYRRTTDLSQLKNWLLDHYPPGYVRLLLEENPGRVVRGEDMVPVR